MSRAILALEAEWEHHISDRTSVVSALQFLRDTADIPFWHRRIPTPEALYAYLERGLNEKQFQILYFAMHGTDQRLEIGGSDKVIYLETLCRKLEGRLGFKNIVVHFGACSFMNQSEKIFKKFKERTGAKIVSGYCEEIDFVDSMLLDMAYFNFLNKGTKFSSIHSGFIQGIHSKLIQQLGFVAY